MAYRKVTKEELDEYLARNPGATYRVNGQEQRGSFGDEDQGALMKILTGLTKPIRSIPASVYSAISGKEGEDNPFLTAREEASYYEDPTKFGTKAAAGLGSFLIPGGGGGAATVGGRIGTAAARGAGAGVIGGFSASEEDNELESILKGAGLGGVIGGGLQAGGEAIKALKGAGAGAQRQYINTNDVDDIAKLPNKTQKGLAKQAKSAGFWDDKMSQSQNIKNYLNNRGLAGNTPAETLENMTQAFNEAQKLKQEGLEEISGLGRGYIDQVKGNIDESLKFSGMLTEPDGLRAYKDVMNSLSPGKGVGLNAKDLDNLIMKWNEAGRLASGAQKTSASGIYAQAAKQLRDTLRSVQAANKYDTALQALNQILGIEDVGNVAKMAGQAADVGLDLPLFAGAGFRGADVKTPIIRDVIDKTRAAQGRALEQGVSPLASVGGAIGEAGSSLAGVGRAAQRVGPALASQMTGDQAQPEQIEQSMGQIQQGGLQQDELQALNYYLANAILQGDISATEAKAVTDLLGIGGGATGPTTEGQRDYQMAAQALQNAYQLIDEGAGKLPTIGGNIAGFFGGTTGSSEYKSSLDTATAFLRKALIGTGQSEAELKNLNLPKPTDEPAIAKQKIEALIPLLRARAGLQSY